MPAEIRHRLWLQRCCEPLCGLGQQEALTLAEEEEHWRVDRLLELLRQHRDSVEFLGLTLDGLLDRCELPGRDRSIFVRMVSGRLGLSGTDEPLAPRLEHTAESPDEPSEPVLQLSKEDIRQAILHSEPAVHRAAMSYFADMGADDPGIAALVINAIRAMEDDRDRTFA